VGYGLVNVANSISYISKLVPAGPIAVANPPVVTPAPVAGKIEYSFDRLSRSNISGWVRESGNTANKLRVEIKINGRIMFSEIANQARNDGSSGNGFSMSPKRFLRLKKNVVEIRFIDSINNRVVLGYSGIIKR
jgi:hypothetical protein